jgi:hypothetical protein
MSDSIDEKDWMEAARSEARLRIESAVDAVLSGQSDLLEVEASDSRELSFWLLRDPGSPEGFEMVPRPVPDEPLAPNAIGFPASSARPAGYPEEVPFLDGSAVIINPVGSKIRVFWLSPRHPVAALRELVEESIASGWKHVDDAPLPLASREPRYVELRKEAKARLLVLRVFGSHGDLSMVEEDAIPAARNAVGS